MEFEVVFFRLILVFILSFAFGLERQFSHKPVGFGTFIFVAVGSCGLTLTAIGLGYDNPIPLLAAIVTGIGFLGAGALIKTTDKIFGFTTAAGIWLFAILGLVVGVGSIKIALILYGMIWLTILTNRFLEKGWLISYQKRLEIKIKGLDKEKKLDDLFKEFKIKKRRLLHKKVNKKEEILTLHYVFEGSGKNMRAFLDKVEKVPYFMEFSFE